MVRARRIQGKGDDSAVKLRPVVPGQMPDKLRRSPAFRVEVDALPGGLRLLGRAEGLRCAPPTCATRWPESGRCASCSPRSSGRSTPSTRRPASASTTCPSSGPIFVLKLRMTPPELGRRLVAEMWAYPDGSRVLELSTRCATDRGVRGRGRDARVPGRRTASTSRASSRPRHGRRSSSSRTRRADDRSALGMAGVRRRGGAGRADARGAGARAHRGQRRDLPAVAPQRRLGEAARRPGGRQAAAAPPRPTASSSGSP